MTQEVDFKSEAVMRCPYASFESLRETGAVQRNRSLGGWVVVNYGDVREILKNPQDFSSQRMDPYMPRNPEHRDAVAQITGILDKFMPFMDPPDQTRLREIVSSRFVAPIVARGTEHIQRIVDDLIDGFVETGKVDLLHAFAYMIPSTVICDMMGVPRNMVKPVQVWVEDVAEYIASSTDPSRYDRARAALFALYGYFARLTVERQQKPGDDLVSLLIAARQAGKLSDEELIICCILFIVGGHDTTANLIGNGFYWLLSTPEQLERLRSNPELSRSAVEEILRYRGTAITIVRKVTRDLDFKGSAFKKGDIVFLFVAAANRDPQVFDDAQGFDVGRKANGHLAFGFGNHVCLGGSLARLETRIAIDTALARLPGLRLETVPQFKPQLHLRGVSNLPVVFTPGQRMRTA